MPGKTPNSSGKKPADTKEAKGKGKKDEEVTVVVPPSKGGKDADEDVEMDTEEPVDPSVQTAAGEL
jgi:26S proteasome regulatory subunit N3